MDLTKDVRIRSGLAALTALMLASAAPEAAMAAAAPDGQTIAARGVADHGTPPCQSCHGANGEGNESLNAPRLASLDAGYLVRQLDLFASDTRRNDLMGPIAKTLTAQEREAVAGFYAGLRTTAAAPGAKGAAEKGAGLATVGNWSADIPPCASCHGPQGLGVGAVAPRLAGQSASYLEAALAQWRSGDRQGDPLGLMAGIAKRLSADDAKAVADYYAALGSTAAPSAGSTRSAR